MSETTLPPVIEQMQKPEFYPHPVTEPIKLLQTHISYVLLTGEFAYKVKKPVDFGFINFSTLEKRQHFCNEELRMNQRGARDWYLEVLPITQSGDRIQLGGDGETVEYALKMRQFPQDALFSEMHARGELTEQHLEDLGHFLARFHATSPTNDHIRTFGEVSQIRAAFDENYEQTQKYIGGPQTQQQFEETKRYTDRFFEERQDLFERRVQNDKIRECHGDLHMRNIALCGDQLIIFDCIEFNEPFRFVDFMYDVAFAVMDLDARQSPQLGNAFLNAYIEPTGDWEGLQLLPLYLSRQAYVRAKVTSFLLDDPGVPEADKKQASESAAKYYRLAWEYTQQRDGRLMLMSGLSGSGKSTVARQVARRTNAIHLRSDAVRKHLAGIPLDQRGGKELYTPEMTQKTYGRLRELGVMLASQGFPVILDAKYDRVGLRQEVISAAKEKNLPVEILHCAAPMEVLRQRLDGRTGDVADATSDLLDSQQKSAESFTQDEQGYVRTIDTTKEIEPQLPV